jgi:hypothetical protein
VEKYRVHPGKRLPNTPAKSDEEGCPVKLRDPHHRVRWVGALIIAAALSACGGGAVAPEAYVKSVCQAVSDWQGQIQDRSTSLEESLGTDPSPEQGKAALTRFLDGVITDSERMVDRVEGAGSPDIEDGEDLANRLKDALEQVLQAFRDARTEVEDIPTSSPEEFQQGADEVGNTIQSAFTEAGATFDQPSPELDPIFEREPACNQLST